MRRFYPALFAVLAIMGILSGCGSKSSSLTVAGSTSIQPFMELLAEEYMSRNPGAQINVQGGGSSSGIKAALEGTAEIGMASRELASDERDGGAVPVVIARDGIAIAVHPNNPVKSMTLQQIRDVFSGRVTDWASFGGSGAIIVVMREEGSGTRGAFDDLVLGKDNPTKNAIIQGSTGAVRATVAGDINAIGYVSLAQVNDTIRILSVNGVIPTAATILNGTYAIARPFNIVTKEKATGEAQKFIEFIMSTDGRKILADEGLVVQ